MYVLIAPNAHSALRQGINMLATVGVERDSRNGPVLMHPEPVTTVYEHPMERIVFWGPRDYNPAFVLYESLWMLRGRNDLAPLLRYVKTFGDFSDDGKTLHGAYGWRWRHHFDMNQLGACVVRLTKDKNDRRSVIQMWDPDIDLDILNHSKDVPCNLVCTPQISPNGTLDLTVFCRSNDIIWGAYYANAFHFSMLQEYLATRIGVPVGIYRQISVNYHAYRKVYDPLWTALQDIPMGMDPYAEEIVSAIAMPRASVLDEEIRILVEMADSDFLAEGDDRPPNGASLWFGSIHAVLRAHSIYRLEKDYGKALELVEDPGVKDIDWCMSMASWLRRRKERIHHA